MTTQKTGRTTPKGTGSKGAADGPTSASSWKKKSVGGTLLSVPSGNTALVRSPGMEVFLTRGIIPNSLIPMVQEAMQRGAAPKDEDIQDLMNDPKKIEDIVELADAVTVYCCVDPIVAPRPTDEAGNVLPIGHPDRDEDVLYVDEVDFADKMFIFNFAVRGSADLSGFRPESTPDVGSVPEQ